MYYTIHQTQNLHALKQANLVDFFVGKTGILKLHGCKVVFNINGIDYSENIINTIKNINYDCLKHLTLQQQ